MTVTKDFLPIGPCRPGNVRRTTESITLHWVGPYPGQTPNIVRAYWASLNNNPASAHFVIKGDTVLQCIPLDEIAYHAGTKQGNETSIGIEVIPCTVDGLFSDSSILTIKGICTIIKATYGVLPLKRHYDWTSKDCPRWYTPLVVGGDEHWLQLKEILNG